jgi:hypothetical protein
LQRRRLSLDSDRAQKQKRMRQPVLRQRGVEILAKPWWSLGSSDGPAQGVRQMRRAPFSERPVTKRRPADPPVSPHVPSGSQNSRRDGGHCGRSGSPRSVGQSQQREMYATYTHHL